MGLSQIFEFPLNVIGHACVLDVLADNPDSGVDAWNDEYDEEYESPCGVGAVAPFPLFFRFGFLAGETEDLCAEPSGKADIDCID